MTRVSHLLRVRTDSAPARDVPGALFEAARERSPCRIRYLKPGASGPEVRTVHPRTVARAEGHWYVLGEDPDAADDRVRIFRMDRILEAEVAGGSYQVPDDFAPSEYVDRRRLFRADDTVEPVPRYSPFRLSRHGVGRR